MSAPTMTICEQANHLDRMLLCLAEHLAGHDGEHQDHGEERTERPVDGATDRDGPPYAPRA